MFTKILVATDVSEASNHVINCLHQLLPLGAKEVVLAHSLGIRHLDSLKQALTKFVEPHLLLQKRNLEEQGFATKIEIGPGSPSFEINRINGLKVFVEPAALDALSNASVDYLNSKGKKGFTITGLSSSCCG